MIEKKTSYLLRVHPFYDAYVSELKSRLQKLKASLSSTAFKEHPDVKQAARLRRATTLVIPEDPDRPEYRLKGNLKKYRRYKQGLQRYRLFFCNSNQPAIIAYLYINDRETLRKSGSKNDPYSVFSKLVAQGKLSSNPDDPVLLHWLAETREGEVVGT